MGEEKKIAVVTGGARGIGEAITRRLHHQGFSVVVLDREEPEELGDLSSAAEYVNVDVTSADGVAGAMGQVEENYGPVNVLCNNAGVSSMHGCNRLDGSRMGL